MCTCDVLRVGLAHRQVPWRFQPSESMAAVDIQQTSATREPEERSVYGLRRAVAASSADATHLCGCGRCRRSSAKAWREHGRAGARPAWRIAGSQTSALQPVTGLKASSTVLALMRRLQQMEARCSPERLRVG
jgi:hypothetical protein